MEKNIFEGAKFGDKFLTRDGNIAIYLWGESHTYHYLLVQGYITSGYLTYFGSGIHCLGIERLDIIFRYQEPIDENELNDEASEYAIKADVDAHSMIVNQKMSESTASFNVVCEAYKAGYCKALGYD